MGRSLSLVLALSPRVIWSNSRRFLSVIFCGLLYCAEGDVASFWFVYNCPGPFSVIDYFQPTQIYILKLTHSWGDDLTSPDVTVTRGQASGGWRSERGWGGSDIGTGPVMRGAAVTWRPHLESVHFTNHLHLDALPRVPDYCDGLLHRPRGYLVDGDHLVPLPTKQYVIL